MTKIDQLALKAIALAYRVQRETELCVFIDYSGHVEKLGIDIRHSADNYLPDVGTLNMETYLDTRRWYDPEERLGKIVEILEYVLEGGCIPSDIFADMHTDSRGVFVL